MVRPAVGRGPVALRSCADISCAVPCRALLCWGASLGSVLYSLFRCGDWVVSCLVRCCGGLLYSVCPWAQCCVVLLCHLWSRCCFSLCRVSGLVCLRRCSLCGALSPLWRWLVLCVVASCVWAFAVGPGSPLLSPGGSWWLLASCFGGAVPVWLRGPPPRGFVWWVLVLRYPVLSSVVLCCRVVVCWCALLFVCVVACDCGLFPAAVLPLRCAVWSCCLSCCAAAFGVGVPVWRVAGCPLMWCGMLCGLALSWYPACLCCYLLCCASLWCCGVLSCCLLWLVACVCLRAPTLKTTAKFV